MVTPKMSVNIAGIEFKNPVMAASGTFGFGKEYQQFFDIGRLGAICVKGLTLEPRQGNPPPRIAEVPAGILNSVGLQNPGIEAFIRKELPNLLQTGTKIIANVSGNTIEDYCEMVEILSYEAVDAIELNVSCPNVKQGCMAFGNTPSGIYEVTARVREKCKQPLFVKLTPNVLDIKEIALKAQDAGADAISLINTILGMAIDVKTRRPILNNNYGGLSGPCIKPIALRMVHEVYKTVTVPVIGMGGIMSGDDAVEFMLAGSKAVMVGTASFVDPYACINILEGLAAYLKSSGDADINSLTGSVRLHGTL